MGGWYQMLCNLSTSVGNLPGRWKFSVSLPLKTPPFNNCTDMPATSVIVTFLIKLLIS